MLLPGQTAFDRPEVTVRIFHEKLKRLLENLRNGHYFGDSLIIYELRVIEYQHRGLPHAHLVFKLSDTPDRENIVDCCNWIDEWILAEMPDPVKEPELYSKVNNHMLHKCSKNIVNGCINKSGFCKRGFSNEDLIMSTYFDEKGYPIYRRRKKEDLKIVSYHKDILLDWDGHINVEYCGKSYVILYLYKYLFKGNRKNKIMFDNTNDLHEKDEIGHYIRGRLICSMDAMWRCFGYQTYPATNPSVMIIKVKMPDHIENIKGEGKMCDLDIYFRRPECLKDFKYTEFYENYDYSTTYPKKYINYNGCNSFDEMILSNYVFNVTERCSDLLSKSKLKTKAKGKGKAKVKKKE
jgi:hypothetical protein